MPRRRIELTFNTVQAKFDIPQTRIGMWEKHRTVYEAKYDVLNVSSCGFTAEVPNKILIEHISKFGNMKVFSDKIEKIENVDIKTGTRIFQYFRVALIWKVYPKQ